MKKEEAIRMRKAGHSYSQIKAALDVSKSTLSLWLSDMPLPETRLRQLRDFNAQRIERYRETRRKTRESRWADVRAKAAKDIGRLSERELRIAGLFLYWGEGGKTKSCSTTLSNNDPAMIRFFIRWLAAHGIPKNKLRVHMHLYSDMDVPVELGYWSRVLGLPLSSFRKPYIKKSKRAELTYPQKFVHGTCELCFENRDMAERTLQSLEYVRSLFADKRLM